jgi:hypothetical protein
MWGRARIAISLDRIDTDELKRLLLVALEKIAVSTPRDPASDRAQRAAHVQAEWNGEGKPAAETGYLWVAGPFEPLVETIAVSRSDHLPRVS